MIGLRLGLDVDIFGHGYRGPSVLVGCVGEARDLSRVAL